jgi:transformation/transcription domain-associated protein
MGCYIEAVQIDANEKTRIHLPKCLWILTKDGSSSPGVLCQTLESRGTKLPPWVWLPWIPQLLTGLCRAEGRAIKSILSRVVKAYPQAVYYSLRAFYLERRDVERAKGIPSTSSQHMPSVAYAEEMMSTLRRSHASLWSSLEAILEELIVKFRPSYEEELLATISALLERAESHAEKQSLPDQTRMEDEDAMVASWSKTLSRIAAKFFRSATDSSATSNRRDERVKKTAEFKRKYKADFESDFKVDTTEVLDSPSPGDSKPQFRLGEYITRLQKWKVKLEEQVLCTPTSLPLIESSHALAMFAGEPPDLWPGACDTKYLSTGSDVHQDEDDDSSRHQSTASSSAAIARKAALNAAVAAASDAAREGVGGEYGGGSAVIEIPGQYCPNSANTADIKPFPELHAKLERFEPFVEVLRRNDQLVRRVGMVGSDGRVYRFLLQFAIPYWTRTDERTAQTNFIIDKFLRQNNVSARNNLSIQPSAAIPVAQRLRMTLDTESRVALDDVFRSSQNSSEKKLEEIPEFFLKEVEEKLRSQTTQETTQGEREKLEKLIRQEVFTDICKSKVDPQVFLRFVQSNLDGPENLFQFRRAFAGQLASNSLLQYIFSVAERTPPRFVLLLCKALVLSPDFRVSYSNQGTPIHGVFTLLCTCSV